LSGGIKQEWGGKTSYFQNNFKNFKKIKNTRWRLTAIVDTQKWP